MGRRCWSGAAGEGGVLAGADAVGPAGRGDGVGHVGGDGEAEGAQAAVAVVAAVLADQDSDGLVVDRGGDVVEGEFAAGVAGVGDGGTDLGEAGVDYEPVPSAALDGAAADLDVGLAEDPLGVPAVGISASCEAPLGTGLM